VSIRRILTIGAVALGLTVALPYHTGAQIAQRPQPPTTTAGTSSQPPTGAATGTTDKQGQTNEPNDVNRTQPSPKGDVVGDPDRPPATPSPVGKGGTRSSSQQPGLRGPTESQSAPRDVDGAERATRDDRTSGAPPTTPRSAAPTITPGSKRTAATATDTAPTPDTTGTSGVSDRLPETGSAMPLIGLAAIVVVALGLAVRFGVNSIE
jgi:hypothetical protein